MNKTLQLSPAMLLGILLTILPTILGGIWTASNLYSRLEVTEKTTIDNVDAIANFKATDTSGLQERIAKLEAQLKSIEQTTSLVNEKINDTEASITIWAEKEFKKVYDILNKNPLQQ